MRPEHVITSYSIHYTKLYDVEVGFEKGFPVSLNGEKIGPVEILTKLNKVAGENGVGVIDIVENRLVGMNSRGIYETAGVV